MGKHGHGALVTLGLIVTIGTMLAGCGSSTTPGPQAFAVPAPPPQQAEYVIQPGDARDISFYYHPDNNQHDILVRPDGTVLLTPIGEGHAAGRTTTQLPD